MIISITPDLALDEGYTYAGGLGVLEGDKFYGAAKLGIPYKVLCLLYHEGYVDYEFDDQGNPLPKPQPQPKEFLDKFTKGDTFTIELKGQSVKVEALRYQKGSAEAVFFRPLEPDWAYHLVNRLYIERDIEEKFFKYVLLAKASAEFIRRFIGVDEIDYIDLQESYACILPLILKIPGKYRVVIHTAGPWGHPIFPKELFEKEFGYTFISDSISLTEIGLAASSEAFSVSAKHYETMCKIIPHFSEKLRYVTNGIFIDRWMDGDLKACYGKGDLHMHDFIAIRKSIRERFIDSIRRYKDVDIGNRMIIGWCRRFTSYKRPEFVIKAIDEVSNKEAVFIIGGKAHPHDIVGLENMKVCYRLHKERENVIYIPDYTVATAREILKSIDLLLFTPSPGLEACGTSYMKAAVNGVPTLSSPDGGVMELIMDDINGWLFLHILDYISKPGTATAQRIDMLDYDAFKSKLQQIVALYKNNPEKYYKVSLNALLTFIPRVSIERVLNEYYPRIVRVWH
ncbi:MAG: glycogen/starch/alpha-glucan phosphorylase [Nitrososphaerota archaeon]|nr:glycogen/starch/alpha-glucan phosphorylase [Nitrososphaerales archaeon]MDW8044230.1 glycogen/starch/alpha-glucan phosphorylase [Nitrososphaerota archaeon]